MGQDRKQEEPSLVIQLGEMDIFETCLGNVYHLC